MAGAAKELRAEVESMSKALRHPWLLANVPSCSHLIRVEGRNRTLAYCDECGLRGF